VDCSVLVVDDRIPDPAAGSGSPRAFDMLLQLANSGFSVALYTTAGERDDPLKVGRAGVEVLDPGEGIPIAGPAAMRVLVVVG